MSAMKRLATEFQLHPGRSLARFHREEQRAWRSLEAGSDSLLRLELEAREPAPTAGGLAQADVVLRMTYTGMMPDVAGKYMVVDLVTDTKQFTSLYRATDGRWRVWLMESQHSEPLDSYLRKGLQWFLISELSKDDLTFIRELSVARGSQ